MKELVIDFLADESGVSAIQYALVATLLSITVIPNLGSISGALNGIFGTASTNLTN